jgi:peptide chain release factor 2
MIKDIIGQLEDLYSRIVESLEYLDLPKKEARIAKLEKEIENPNFWEDQRRVDSVMAEMKHLKNLVTKWQNLKGDVSSLLDLAKSFQETKTGASEEIAELEAELGALKQKFSQYELELLLDGPYDTRNALLSFHAGTGGTDAQDWAEMLMRMILRYCEHKGFKTTILHQSYGSEAGIKSATIEVVGTLAYGWLKSEKGVHRLVRKSPFNAKNLRQTSFALIEVIPEIEEEVKDLDEKDLEIETFRSSGHGGQSVNTTDSAVRITHKPSGLVVTCQNERSQMQNRATAIRILKTRLAELYRIMEEKKIKDIKGAYEPPQWGNQIRSYVMHPYKMVKDHRTDFETSDVDAVLDGKIDSFVEAFLRWSKSSSSNLTN